MMTMIWLTVQLSTQTRRLTRIAAARTNQLSSSRVGTEVAGESFTESCSINVQ